MGALITIFAVNTAITTRAQSNQSRYYFRALSGGHTRAGTLDPLIKNRQANLALRHPAISSDQLAGAPGCFSGCARAKASIIESELAIRVKFENGAR